MEKELCEYCDGEGVIPTDIADNEGNIMQGVGEDKKCICQIN